jgi:ribose 5-phosphate isomerase A
VSHHTTTGFQSKELIVSNGLILGDVDQYPRIDVTLDGADECVGISFFSFSDLLELILKIRVDKDLNCIKGGGACHLREKVLAEAADT